MAYWGMVLVSADLEQIIRSSTALGSLTSQGYKWQLGTAAPTPATVFNDFQAHPAHTFFSSELGVMGDHMHPPHLHDISSDAVVVRVELPSQGDISEAGCHH
jgi:hypothetical protein